MCVIDIMNWVNSRQFKIADRNGRHYVFRRNNAGNTEINIPKTITTKAEAARWLKVHPNKVANPTRRKSKRSAAQPGGLKPFERMVNGKKMIRFTNKEGKQYFRPAPGPEPSYFLNILRAKGKNVPWKYTCNTLKQGLKKRVVLGRGRQGIVFLASKYSNGRYPFAIKVSPRDLRAEASKEKQPGDVEFDIQSAAYKAAPNGVAAVHQILDCVNFVAPTEIDMKNVQSSRAFDKSKQKVMLMEYCAGGSLSSWLEKQHAAGKIDEGTIQTIISSIAKTLYKIHEIHPEFRHNDLHLENIFVSDRGFLIGDFGWARLKKTGTNPAVNTANGTGTTSKWGVGPKSDLRYDYHLLFNEMRSWLGTRSYSTKLPLTFSFLNKCIPPGYRGKTDAHVSEWRIKYDDPCPGLPSLLRVVRDPYVSRKKITSINLTQARARLRKLNGTPLKPAKKPVNRKYTNAELINLQAMNFMKLSPVTRERAKVLRAAAKNKGKTQIKNKGKMAENATKRTNTKVTHNVPKVTRKRIPPAVLKSNKFNKLITQIYKTQGGPANESFNNAWNRARTKAMNRIQNRLNKNQNLFTPSPPKPKVKTPSPPKPKVKTPSPPKAINLNYKLSPKSGRVKIKAPNSGRYVYANGASVSLEYLKKLASLLQVNIKGLRSKANIAKMIFSANAK